VLAILEEALLVDVELRRQVRRVVLSGRGLEWAEVGAVNLVALHQADMPQPRGGLVTSQRVGHWTHYRRNEARLAEIAGKIATDI
jgi:hypothetical protein